LQTFDTAVIRVLVFEIVVFHELREQFGVFLRHVVDERIQMLLTLQLHRIFCTAPFLLKLDLVLHFVILEFILDFAFTQLSHVFKHFWFIFVCILYITEKQFFVDRIYILYLWNFTVNLLVFASVQLRQIIIGLRDPGFFGRVLVGLRETVDGSQLFVAHDAAELAFPPGVQDRHVRLPVTAHRLHGAAPCVWVHSAAA